MLAMHKSLRSSLATAVGLERNFLTNALLGFLGAPSFQRILESRPEELSTVMKPEGIRSMRDQLTVIVRLDRKTLCSSV